MPLTIVTNPNHRDRCVACLERVSDTEGPWFDFGEFEDALVEKVGEGQFLAKGHHHNDVLVCSGCIRKAYLKLPDEQDTMQKLQSRLMDAIEERNEWRELAMAGESLNKKLDEVLTRTTAKVPPPVKPIDPAPAKPEPDAPTAADVNPKQSYSVESPAPEVENDSKPGRPADGEPDPDDPGRSPLWDLSVKDIKARLREQGISIPSDLTKKADIIAWAESLDDDPEPGEAPEGEDKA